jgi:hypothetical protein
MTTLYYELTTDPEALGYAPLIAAGSHNRVAEILNRPRYAALGKIGIAQALIWMAKHGILARLRAAVQGSDPMIASIAEVATMLVSNPNIAEIDLGLTDVQTMLGALVAAEVIPSAAHDELMAIAMVQRSRAEMLFGRTITVDEVSEVLDG